MHENVISNSGVYGQTLKFEKIKHKWESLRNTYGLQFTLKWEILVHSNFHELRSNLVGRQIHD